VSETGWLAEIMSVWLSSAGSRIARTDAVTPLTGGGAAWQSTSHREPSSCRAIEDPAPEAHLRSRLPRRGVIGIFEYSRIRP